MKKIRLLRIASVFFLILLCAEGFVRLGGFIDFPTYLVDAEIGYVPKPSQKGVFLRRNSWVFNNRSMGTAENWQPGAKKNILLIGNSIVIGGNPFDQKERLGSLIQKEIGEGYAVWPIAAGGWTNVNETAYLNHNPDVAEAAHFFVWEYMGGGLSGLTEWEGNGEYVFPTSTPVWGSWYVFRRYVIPRVMPRMMPLNVNQLPRVGAVDARNLTNFEAAIAKLSLATRSKRPGILFIYPRKAEQLMALQGKEWLPERAEMERIAHATGLEVVDVSHLADWNETLYRADGVHPTVQGNVALAKILTSAIRDTIAHRDGS